MSNGPIETRKWFAVGLAIVIAWVIFMITQGPRIGVGQGDGPILEGTGLKQSADFAWTLEDLNGAPVEFAKFKGKPIVLNIWATWCPPCREEMPSLAKLAADPKMKEKGVVVVCASVDQSMDALKSYVQGKNWGMTILHARSTPLIFTTDGIPATFLIGPDGQIAAMQVGSARWDDPSVVAFLEKLATVPQ